MFHLVALVSFLLTSAVAQTARPAETSAARAQVRELSDAGKFDDALAAYDAYVAANSNRTDPALLAVIARGRLHELADSQDSTVATAVVERLAAAGDANALASLRQRAAAPPGSEAAKVATEALLRIGDKDTLAQVTRTLESAEPSRRAELIQILERTGATSAGPSVAHFLEDESPQVRMRAAIAVGGLGVKSAIPTLQVMFAKDAPIVRQYAAVALERLGDHSADAYVGELLKSDLPEMRLMAADAYPPADSRIWLPAVRELRNNPNELVRVQAAARLACCEPATSRAILIEMINAPNPLVRTDAARVLDESGVGDARTARRLLQDRLEMPRVYGAGIALRLAREPARGAAR